MKDIHIQNRKRCIAALVLCSLVFITAAIALLVGVTVDGNYVYLGLENLRYFTYESNIFAALCAFLCIPFQIDGLRNDNYHLPRWVVNLLYISTCTVTVTLLLAAVFVLPFKGFYLSYIDKGNYYVHFLTPVMAIIAFIFINDDHNMNRNMLWYTMIPLLIYGTIYVIEVFGKENWNDHYHIVGVMPPVLAVIMVVVVYFGIAVILRKLHNRRHELSKKEIKEYYMASDEVSYPTIEEAISNLAIRNRKYDRGGDIAVPRRIIILMEEKYQSGRSIDELCAFYVKELFTIQK